MIQISNRLQQAAGMVTKGNILADIGTDHGYIPIYLMQKGVIPKAIAMDINAGPLERAKEHIIQYGLGDYIETRRSDGVASLLAGEADSILIAGMGGGLVIHILQAGRTVCQQAAELILQPQSELERVRRFLDEEGYAIDEEEMVFEDGKYYPMMRVHFEKEHKTHCDSLAYLYGGILLKKRHSVLQQYLQMERELYTNIAKNLEEQPESDKIRQRKEEVQNVLKQNANALHYMEEK